MRLPGYCTRCHRPRQVQVSGHGLAVASAGRGVPQGICSACESYELAERRFRAGARVYDRTERRHGRLPVDRHPVERGAHEATVWVLFDGAAEPERVPAGRLETQRR